jgi:superfamily II DNA or RNA helicase
MIIKDLMNTISMIFKSGTVEIRGIAKECGDSPPGSKWDKRIGAYRAMAMDYGRILGFFEAKETLVEDHCSDYLTPQDSYPLVSWAFRDYQLAALEAWRATGRSGIVSLPTGTGKTYVGVAALAEAGCGLVVAPTLDLVWQWHGILSATFNEEVGVIGGGDYDVQRFTVTTYDSAHLHMEHLGDKFSLLVFDECHHLPTQRYAMAAKMSLAPSRLGLSATPQRAKGEAETLQDLIGSIVYEKDIVELKGTYLADYDVQRIEVDLNQEEREEYETERKLYLQFLKDKQIRLGGRFGWTQFIRRASQSEEGRRAIVAHRKQRELAQTASAKMDVLEQLIHRHRADSALVFTEDNRTAYAISRKLLIPIITHQTRVKERTLILNGLRDRTYNAIVTSKVLNEGVDVPSANIAIVVSGSGTVREHVQRLGRVLRQQEGKIAILYEIVSKSTGEMSTSSRRRKHHAYKAGDLTPNPLVP